MCIFSKLIATNEIRRNKMNTAIVYAIYLAITVAMTVWVAQTLYRSGKLFLIDAFHGNVEMADAVNHLLRVGFYLVNLGFVALFLSVGYEPKDVVGAIEYISSKVGIVLIVLGVMHFFNMFNIGRMRRKAIRHAELQPQT
jgi:hypothetical protein